MPTIAPLPHPAIMPTIEPTTQSKVDKPERSAGAMRENAMMDCTMTTIGPTRPPAKGMFMNSMPTDA
jgi:hypothetical protein